MNLYKHYKNKYYKVTGEVKHSETAEDLVLYETLYESPGGKFWVRPKKMFFEEIDLDGDRIQRFSQVPLEILTATQIKEPQVQIIAAIMEKAFGEWDASWFYSRIKTFSEFHLLIASIEGNPVGFKLGYRRDQAEFYSWLGAVLPEYRQLGIAKELMLLQHEWCLAHDYRRIQTETLNENRAMIMLNLKSGFEIIGTRLSEKFGLKIILEKKLDALSIR